MNVLLIGTQDPGRHSALAAALGNEVDLTVAVASWAGQPGPRGARSLRYPPPPFSTRPTHPAIGGVTRFVERGEALLGAVLQLQGQGFLPDVIWARGDGSTMLLNQLNPIPRLVVEVDGYSRPPWWRDPELARGPGTIDTTMGEKAPDLLGDEIADRWLRARVDNVGILFDAVHADWLLCPSAALAADLPDFLRPRVTVVPEPVELGRFRPGAPARDPADADAWLGAVNLCAAELIVVTSDAGAMPELVAVLRLLSRRRARASVVVLSEEPLDDLDLVRAGLDPARVTVLAEVDADDRVRLYRSAALVLAVGSARRWPAELVEALACGALVVAALNPVTADLIEHGVTGYLGGVGPDGDAGSLIDVALWVADNRARLEAVRHAARAASAARFDPAPIGRYLADLFRWLVAGHGPLVRPRPFLPQLRGLL